MSDTAAVRAINPSGLAPPPGYSQIVEVRAARLVFISGQTSCDETGRVVGKGDFAAQAEQVFRNLGIALRLRIAPRTISSSSPSSCGT